MHKSFPICDNQQTCLTNSSFVLVCSFLSDKEIVVKALSSVFDIFSERICPFFCLALLLPKARLTHYEPALGNASSTMN